MFSKRFYVQCFGADEIDINLLSGTCLFVTSTFGNGDPPTMTKTMADELENKVNQINLQKTETAPIKLTRQDYEWIPNK